MVRTRKRESLISTTYFAIVLMKALLLLITSLVLSGSLWTENKEIEFKLSCKLTDQVLLEVDQGNSKEYQTITEGKKVGEEFTLDFRTYEFSQVMPDKIDSMILSFHLPQEVYKDGENMRITFPENEYSYDSYFEAEGEFNEKEIRIFRTPKYYRGFNLVLRRYYKNDWGLILSRQIKTTELTDAFHTLTANCLGMPRDYEILLQRINFYLQKDDSKP